MLNPEPLRRDHVRRPPLPWRPGEDITECGRLVADVDTVIEPDQLVWRKRNWGAQRTAFTVCMTCANLASYSPVWEADPVAVVTREARRSGANIGSAARDAAYTGKAADPRRELLSHELRAMIALVAEHRDEFEAYVQASVDAAAFADRRARKARESR